MKELVIMSAVANICGILGTVLLYTSFFTSHWVYVRKQVDSVGDEDIEYIESNHGLWDNGITDLNCIVTPFGICMYTRAALFAGMVLSVPSVLFNILSTAIVASGGMIQTSGTLARAGATMMTLTDIAVIIGSLLFTISHTQCSDRSTCGYYPLYPTELTFGWSFILTWISILFFLSTTVILYVFSCLAQKKYKVTFSPNNLKAMQELQSEGVSIELVRVNQSAIDKDNATRQN